MMEVEKLSFLIIGKRTGNLHQGRVVGRSPERSPRN